MLCPDYSAEVSYRKRARHARTSRMRTTTQPPLRASSAPLTATSPPPSLPSSLTVSPRKVRPEPWSWGEAGETCFLAGSDKDHHTGQELLALFQMRDLSSESLAHWLGRSRSRFSTSGHHFWAGTTVLAHIRDLRLNSLYRGKN